MGTPVSDMLMDLSPEGLARRAALAEQQNEADRMARQASGAAPGPPTASVQDIQSLVSGGKQNPDIGMLAQFLTSLGLAGGAPAAGPQPMPQATPTPPPLGYPTIFSGQQAGDAAIAAEKKRQGQ